MPKFRKFLIASLAFIILLELEGSTLAAFDISPLIAKPTSKTLIRKYVSQGQAAGKELIDAYPSQENEEVKIAILRIIAQIEPSEESKAFWEKLHTSSNSSEVEKFFAENAALLFAPDDVALQDNYLKNVEANEQASRAFDFKYLGDRGLVALEAMGERLPDLSDEQFDAIFYALLNTLGSDSYDFLLSKAEVIFSKMLQSPVEEWYDRMNEITSILESCKSDSWRNDFIATLIGDPRILKGEKEGSILASLLTDSISTYEDALPEGLLEPIAKVFFNDMTSSTDQDLDAFSMRRDRLLALYLMLKDIQYKGSYNLKSQMEAFVEEHIFSIAGSDVVEFHSAMSGVISGFYSAPKIILKLLESDNLQFKTLALQMAREISPETWNNQSDVTDTVKYLVFRDLSISQVGGPAEIYRLQLHETFRHMTQDSKLDDFVSVRIGLMSKNPLVRLSALEILGQRQPSSKEKVALISKIIIDDEDKDIRRVGFNILDRIIDDDEELVNFKESRGVGLALFSLLRHNENEDIHNSVLRTIEAYFRKADPDAKFILNSLRSDSNEFVAEIARRHYEKMALDHMDELTNMMPSGDLSEHLSENPVLVLMYMENMSEMIATYMLAPYRNEELNSEQSRSSRISRVVEANVGLIEQLIPYTQSEDPEVKKRASDLIERIRTVVNPPKEIAKS